MTNYISTLVCCIPFLGQEIKLTARTDVVEPNADLTGQTVGSKLIVDNAHTYSDLDDLIVNHVQAMARKVEELMAHEKFKHGPEDELRELAVSCIFGLLAHELS